MGDRVLMQVVGKDEVGPVLYCHWSGERAPAIAEALVKRMAPCAGDVAYWSARLVQEAIGTEEGPYSFGLTQYPGVLTEDDSHGDAGCVVINADTGEIRFFGGYLNESYLSKEENNDEDV